MRRPAPSLRQRTFPIAWSSVLCLAASMAWVPPAAIAQAPATDPELRFRDMRRPVDQGFVDRSAIGTSLRRLPSDLSVGRSLDRLYRDPVDPARFRRVQGGLSVVFPRSVYGADEQGTIAMVPPGSVFRLGDRAEPAPPSPPDAPPPQWIGGVEGLSLPGGSRRDPAISKQSSRGPRRIEPRPWVATPIDGRVLAGGAEAEMDRFGFGDPALLFIAEPAEPLPPILADAQYRRARVERLLLEAIVEGR